MDDLRLFAGTSNPALTSTIAENLGVSTGDMTVTRFADGEIRVQIEESVRGLDVFLVQSGCQPVNDNLMELLIAVDAVRRASARRINVVMPYYCYARQDKKVRPREPVAAKLVANLLIEAGASRLLTMDLHAGQIVGFFDVPVDHLYAGPIIADYFSRTLQQRDNVAVVSPDVGGVARATSLAEALGAQIAIVVKRRPEPNRSVVMEVIGDVADKTVILFDDLIDTAGSIVSAAEALCDRGAAQIYAACTHAVLSGDAVRRLEDSPIERIVVTDTIPLPPDKRASSIEVVSVARLMASAIERIHNDGSVSQLFSEHWKGHS